MWRYRGRQEQRSKQCLARSRQRYLMSSKQTSKSVEKSSVAPKPRFAVNNNNNAIILVYIPSRVRRRNNATLKHYYNALACAQSSCEFDFYRRQPHTGHRYSDTIRY